MSEFQPYIKGTVLAPSGKAEHLHVICNDPVFFPINGCDSVLVVDISSVKFGVPYDRACLLQIGDHPFIYHQSYVVYERAVVWRVDNIIRRYDSGEISKHQDMSDATFTRILAGFDISEDAEPKALKFWRMYC